MHGEIVQGSEWFAQGALEDVLVFPKATLEAYLAAADQFFRHEIVVIVH